MDLTSSGEPQELVLGFASTGTALIQLSSTYGFLHLAPPGFFLWASPLPDTGSLTIQLTVPQLVPSIEGLPLFLQIVGLAPGGEFVLGEAGTVVLLDSSF